MRSAAAVFRRRESEMRGFTRISEWRQIVRAVAGWHRVGNIDERLRLLTDRDCRNNFIRERVDRYDGILVFQSNVDARSISRSPNAVRQIAGRNRRNQFRLFATAKNFHRVFLANRYVSELPIRIFYERDMIRDRACIESSNNTERRLRAHHPRLARVFEREPHLPSLRVHPHSWRKPTPLPQPTK